jgi:hypothetical protein
MTQLNLVELCEAWATASRRLETGALCVDSRGLIREDQETLLDAIEEEPAVGAEALAAKLEVLARLLITDAAAAGPLATSVYVDMMAFVGDRQP